MYQAVSQGNRQAGKTRDMLHRHLTGHAPDGALDAVRQTGGYGREQDPYMNCKLMVLAEPMGDGETAEWRPTVSWCGSADLVPGMEGTGLIVRDPETSPAGPGVLERDTGRHQANRLGEVGSRKAETGS